MTSYKRWSHSRRSNLVLGISLLPALALAACLGDEPSEPVESDEPKEAEPPGTAAPPGIVEVSGVESPSGGDEPSGDELSGDEPSGDEPPMLVEWPPTATSKVAQGLAVAAAPAQREICEPGLRCAGTVPGSGLSLRNLVRSGRRSRAANSQLVVPQNITLADVDADGYTDYIQTSQNRLFVSQTDFARTGTLHLYVRHSIKRVITGDFHGDGNDQTCLIQNDNTLACYGISTDRRELWWWFTQGSFIGDSDDFIVGDYNGDGRDDVLIYPRGGGAWRMYSVTGGWFFVPTPSFAPGNLGVATSGLQVRAGDFNADGRDDLALVGRWGEVLYQGSVWDGAANTFWWGFTSRSGMVGSDDQVTIARIDDDSRDDIVLHNRSTGATRFFRMEWGGGSLPPIPHVLLGQISTSTNSLLFWAATHRSLDEPGGRRRDDAMVYERSWNGFVRSDARWDGSRLTYWWAYSQNAPNNHVGWLTPVAKPWLLLKCKFAGLPTIPRGDQVYRDLILGHWGLADYWRDVSYGAWDLYGSRVVDGWLQMGIGNASWRALPGRWERAGACRDSYQGSTDGFVNTISLVNGEGDAGNASGRVLVTPESTHSTFLAHETGHTFGYEHSWDDSGRRAADWSGPGEYYDYWDVMSAMRVHSFNGGASGSAGPGLNAPYLHKKRFIPIHRQLQLNPTSFGQSRRLNLAAVDRPEANGPLYLRIGADTNDHYTVEYRMKSGWDQGIPRSTVLVHRVTNGRSILLTGGGPERMPVTASWFWIDGKWVSVVINGFATAGYTADVTINY